MRAREYQRAQNRTCREGVDNIYNIFEPQAQVEHKKGFIKGSAKHTGNMVRNSGEGRRSGAEGKGREKAGARDL